MILYGYWVYDGQIDQPGLELVMTPTESQRVPYVSPCVPTPQTQTLLGNIVG